MLDSRSGWTGLGSSPLIEGDRLWLTTNRCEVLCMDIGPLIHGEAAPRELWKRDLIKEFDIFPHVPIMGPPRPCSIGPSCNGRIFVTTNNGVSQDRSKVPKPDAPSLVCLNKDTGEVYWTDNAPGANILETQFSSPTVAQIRGQWQVIVPQSDGWIRAFDPETGKSSVRWKGTRGLSRVGHVTPIVIDEGAQLVEPFDPVGRLFAWRAAQQTGRTIHAVRQRRFALGVPDGRSRAERKRLGP
jgi:outer membrane protein assembly factor BamB